MVCESTQRTYYAAKNHILMKEKDTNIEMIPRPKGTAGSNGFSLISKMGLNKDVEEDKTLYYDILVSMIFISETSSYIIISY